MRIRGVFSMSILNRLKSLLKEDREETDINTDVSNTSDDVKVTSSKKENETVVFEKELVVKVTKTTATKSEDSSEDLTSEDIKVEEEPVENSSEEIVKEVETVEEEVPAEVETEEAEVAEEEIPEEVEAEDDVEEVEEYSKNKDTER